MRPLQRISRRARSDAGITGLETAIVLIAFVVVAAVFAFVVLSTGLFSAERGKDTVYAGLAKTRGSMTLTGGVIATSDTTKITDLTLDFTLAAGGDAVNLNPSDTNNRTVISYADTGHVNNNLTYVTSVITGDSDKLLEQGEMLEVTIDLTQDGAIDLVANGKFTLELKPPQGSFMVIQRTIPAAINQTVLNLN